MASPHRRKTDEEAAEHWMNTKWRPLMAISYMITCVCDFVIFPVLWSSLQYKGHGTVTDQWNPLTLANGGMYHMAMGAIIGISAWGRTAEKVSGNNSSAAVAVATAAAPTTNVTPSTNVVPQPAQPSL